MKDFPWLSGYPRRRLSLVDRERILDKLTPHLGFGCAQIVEAMLVHGLSILDSPAVTQRNSRGQPIGGGTLHGRIGRMGVDCL